MSNWSSAWLCWIYRHETLASAFLALIAAGLTILVLVRQIRQSDRQHKLERQKKLEAARAVVPFLDPNLTPPERSVAMLEGWILGVPGLIRDDGEERPGSGGNSCNHKLFRLH